MTLFGLLIALAVFGVLLWAIQQIPMEPTVRQIIRVVAIVALVLWLASTLLGHSALHGVNPRLW